jgi:hypothetical protein
MLFLTGHSGILVADHLSGHGPLVRKLVRTTMPAWFAGREFRVSQRSQRMHKVVTAATMVLT